MYVRENNIHIAEELTKSVLDLELILTFSPAFILRYNSISFTDNSSDPEKESLAQEIELGKSLDGDKHPNIVNFLACVSTSGKTG